MKKISLFLFLFSVVVSPVWAKDVEIQEVKGQVKVFNQQSAQWMPAEKGMELSEGDKIKTGEDGQALIEIKDGNLIVEGNADFTLKSYSSSRRQLMASIELMSGKVRTDMEKFPEKSHIEIVTPTSVAYMHSPSAAVSIYKYMGDLFTRADVYRGNVDLSDPTTGDAVRVSAGRYATGGSGGITTAKDQAPVTEVATQEEMPAEQAAAPVEPEKAAEESAAPVKEEKSEEAVPEEKSEETIQAETPHEPLVLTEKEAQLVSGIQQMIEQAPVLEIPPEKTEVSDGTPEPSVKVEDVPDLTAEVPAVETDIKTATVPPLATDAQIVEIAQNSKARVVEVIQTIKDDLNKKMAPSAQEVAPEPVAEALTPAEPEPEELTVTVETLPAVDPAAKPAESQAASAEKPAEAAAEAPAASKAEPAQEVKQEAVEAETPASSMAPEASPAESSEKPAAQGMIQVTDSIEVSPEVQVVTEKGAEAATAEVPEEVPQVKENLEVQEATESPEMQKSPETVPGITKPRVPHKEDQDWVPIKIKSAPE